MSETAPLIELGVVGSPYGVRGWFKCRSDTEPEERLLEYKRWQLELAGRWQEFELQDSGRSGGQLTAKLKGVDSPEAAALLRGAAIAVRRTELAAPAPGEFFRADLIGCEVFDQTGAKLGAIDYFVETPAHALMVIRGDQNRMIPAVPRHLRKVDLAQRRVQVDWDDFVGAP
jgi:16S rRNA processing protein RimM